MTDLSPCEALVRLDRKVSRALNNGVGIKLSPDELALIQDIGALAFFGIHPVGYVAPPNPIQGTWPTKPVVYFIGPDGGPVKIGYASNLATRFQSIKFMSPKPLHVWAHTPGSSQLEREYHVRFWRSRLHGEWFERTADIEAEIARLSEISA